MYTLFNEVFDELIREMGCEAWYELYKVEGFDSITIRVAERYGVTIIESDEYKEWMKEMS